MEGLFALILERASPRPVAEIGKLLACHLPVHPADATTWVRYGGGLIAKDLPDEIAGELALRLGEIGVKTRRIDSSRWAAAPRGSRVAALDLHGNSHDPARDSHDPARDSHDPARDSLTASLRGRLSRITVPRRDVLGIRVHGLAVERPPEDAARRGARRKRAEAAPGTATLVEAAEAPGIEAPLLSPRGSELLRRLKENGLASMEMHLTLYCAEAPPPAGAEGRDWLWSPLRIAKNAFDYSCLREQKQTHSLDNFLILLEEVLAWLPDAWNRESVERFLSDLDPLGILHFKEEEAENFDRWMLEWVRIEREERGAEGSDP